MSMTYSEHFKEEALKLSDEIGLRKTAQQITFKLALQTQY